MIGHISAYLVRINADGKDNYMIIVGKNKEEIERGVATAIEGSNKQLGIEAKLTEMVNMDEVLATVVGGPPLLILFTPNPAYLAPDEGEAPPQSGDVMLQ